MSSPYAKDVAHVGHSYDVLMAGARPGFESTSRDMLGAARREVGPGNEFDPAVAKLLGYAQKPVDNDLESYFQQKYMADVNGRLAQRGLIGQGVGEGLANDAGRAYSAGRADTALQRILQATGGASSLRSGQAGRAATYTGAGLAPYDTMSRMLSGEAGSYTGAGALENQRSAINNNKTGMLGGLSGLGGSGSGSPFGMVTGLMGSGARGGWNQLFGGDSAGGGGGGGGTADILRDVGGSGGGEALDVTGGYFVAGGGRIPGRGDYDHVPAVLTPQEFVIRRPVAMKARPALERLNSGDFSGAARKLARIGSLAR